LSLPQQQLVEVARALREPAPILVLDEPTAALPAPDSARLLELMAGLRAAGVGLLFVTHRLEEVEACADRVTVLRDGRVAATVARGTFDRGALIGLMVGRAVSSLAARPRDTGLGPVTRQEAALAVEGLSCRALGLADVDLTVAAGEVLGLFGLVGAGRTELTTVICGLERADSGRVRVGGAAAAPDGVAAARACGVALVPEDRRRRGVIGPLSVRDNIALPNLGALSRCGLVDRRAVAAAAAAIAGELRIKAPSLAHSVEALSGGNQQKVALARVLWARRGDARPRVLILDEPTQGVDVGARAEIHAAVHALARQAGTGVLFISSDLAELLAVADRIAVMRRGTVVRAFGREHATPAAVLAAAMGVELDADGAADGRREGRRP
jgi:ABC-type sugar transport system ATPase subunit